MSPAIGADTPGAAFGSGASGAAGAAVIGVAGDLVEDVIVWTSGPIAYGTDTPSRIFHVRGGSAANVAHAVAVQGGASRLITRVGADAVGDRLVSDLEASGVEVRAQRGETSDTIVILIDHTGERTMMPDRSTAKAIETIDPTWLDGLAWLHLPLYGFETEGEARVFSELSRAAAERGVPLSIDVSSVGLIEMIGVDRVNELLELLRPRIVFANEGEAEAIGLASRQPAPGSAWVLKHGGDPVVIRTLSETLEVAVPPVDGVSDTTGAGDHFASGFLRGLVSGQGLAEAAEAGIAAAARVLHSPGAHTA